MNEEERNKAYQFLQELDKNGYRYTADGREIYIIENVFHKIDKLQKELGQEKGKNKKLNLENQALYESINCNDDNMLARRYQILQKELDAQKQGNKDLVKEGVKLSAKIVELEKVINLMAKERAEISEPKTCKEAIIDFYFKQVEEEND